jgi:hypothetical protein
MNSAKLCKISAVVLLDADAAAIKKCPGAQQTTLLQSAGYAKTLPSWLAGKALNIRCFLNQTTFMEWQTNSSGDHDHFLAKKSADDIWYASYIVPIAVESGREFRVMAVSMVPTNANKVPGMETDIKPGWQNSPDRKLVNDRFLNWRWFSTIAEFDAWKNTVDGHDFVRGASPANVFAATINPYTFQP